MSIRPLKTFLHALLFIGAFSARAELRVIGVNVTKRDDNKIVVSIHSDVPNEMEKGLTVAEAAVIIGKAEGGGSLVMVGVQAHGIKLREYMSIFVAILENIFLDLTFVDGAQPSSIFENTRKRIVGQASSRGATDEEAGQYVLALLTSDKRDRGAPQRVRRTVSNWYRVEFESPSQGRERVVLVDPQSGKAEYPLPR